MFLFPTIAHLTHLAMPSIALFSTVLFQTSGILFQEGTLFNILIALVFGFSTLNILALATRGLESRHNRLRPGEVLAITAMVLAVCFLGWEMLHLFHIFPLQLSKGT